MRTQGEAVLFEEYSNGVMTVSQCCLYEPMVGKPRRATWCKAVIEQQCQHVDISLANCFQGRRFVGGIPIVRVGSLRKPLLHYVTIACTNGKDE